MRPYSTWLSAMATDMSPSILILPVMNAIVGLRSPAISASRSSCASLMVQSAGPSVVEIVRAVDHDDAVAAGIELDRALRNPAASTFELQLVGDRPECPLQRSPCSFVMARSRRLMSLGGQRPGAASSASHIAARLTFIVNAISTGR